MVLSLGMLETEIMCLGRPTAMVKSDFKFGSSKQGKTRRASIGSICVNAISLTRSKSMYKTCIKIYEKMHQPRLAGFDVIHAVKAASLILTVETTGEVH